MSYTCVFSDLCTTYSERRHVFKIQSYRTKHQFEWNLGRKYCLLQRHFNSSRVAFALQCKDDVTTTAIAVQHGDGFTTTRGGVQGKNNGHLERWRWRPSTKCERWRRSRNNDDKTRPHKTTTVMARHRQHDTEAKTSIRIVRRQQPFPCILRHEERRAVCSDTFQIPVGRRQRLKNWEKLTSSFYISAEMCDH